jgi:HEAT repeats
MIQLLIYEIVVFLFVYVPTSLGTSSIVDRIRIYAAPFEQDVIIGPGKAFVYVLPCNKEISIWSSSLEKHGLTPALALLTPLLDVGEKPFESIRGSFRPLTGDDFERTWTSDSYIRQGAVITFSQSTKCERHFFVDTYKVIVKEHNRGSKGFSARISVQNASQQELDDLLRGDELRTYFVPRLQDRNATVRAQAIDRLLQYVEHEHLRSTVLRRGLHPIGVRIRAAIYPLANDEDETVKTKARYAMCCLGDKEAIMAFIKPRPSESRCTVIAGYEVWRWFCNCEDKQIAEHVMALLKTNNEGLQLFAVGFFGEAVAMLKNEYEPAREELLRLIYSPFAKVRLAACIELRSEKDVKHEIPAILANLLLERESSFRIEVLSEAGRWNWNASLTDSILPLLQDRDKNVRVMAVESLRGCKNPKINDALINASFDNAPEVRASAATIMARTVPHLAFDRLISLLSDDCVDVRWYAVHALCLIGDSRCLDALRAREKVEPEKKVRDAIKQAITGRV